MEKEPEENSVEDESPTVEEIIEAVRDYLTDEDIADLTDDYDEVLNDITELLEERGHDSSAIFKKKGIIE